MHTDVEPLEVGERRRSVMLGETEPANRESAVSRFSSTASMLTGRHVRAWICARSPGAPPRAANQDPATHERDPEDQDEPPTRAHGQTRLRSDALDSRPSSSFRP